ncbi:hypothetical protein, partial [Acidiplasma aeolicum]|uniref:hypothetical protein n=1 Tax=Acidiplasma aeolicum TaxID=507754 RepID=UPI000A9AAC9D
MMDVDIERDQMKRHAKAFVWANNEEFLKYMDRWVQRTDFKFPLDVKLLEEYSHLNYAEVDARFKPVFLQLQQQIDSPGISSDKKKELKETMKKIEGEYLMESNRANQKDTAIGILEFLESNPLEMIHALNDALAELMVQKGE